MDRGRRGGYMDRGEEEDTWIEVVSSSQKTQEKVYLAAAVEPLESPSVPMISARPCAAETSLQAPPQALPERVCCVCVCVCV